MAQTEQEKREEKRRELEAEAVVNRNRIVQIEHDPLGASLEDLAWLASQIEKNLRIPDADDYQLQELKTDVDIQVYERNRKVYLDFLLRLIPAKASIEGAENQAATNRDLVSQTERLVNQTKTVATWTIIVGIGSIAAVVTLVIIFVANLP